MANGRIDISYSNKGKTFGYVSLPSHPGPGSHACVVKNVPLAKVLIDYRGPDIVLDFDKDGTLIGIEIMGD